MSNPWLKDNLTSRQIQYVALLASGKSTLEIAKELVVSHHTVRNTITKAKERIGANSTYNLVAVAIYKGWIRIDNHEPPLSFIPNE